MARKPTTPKESKQPVAAGRPSTFTQGIVDVICARLAEGVSLRSICRDDGMPSIGAFLAWVGARPTLAEQYARARASCMDAMAEDILDIADTPEIGTKTVSKVTGTETTEGDMVEHRRLRIEARKWLMSKMAPKKYGDKLAIEGGLTVKRQASDLTDDELVAFLAARNAPQS